jgi:membrane associated rhomboid family serine protease
VIPIKDNILNERFPFVTVALITANLVVYVLAIGHGGSLISGPDAREALRYGAIPRAFTHAGQGGAIPTWETAFTSMFINASILQIAVNMLFLWIFGNTLEDAIGPVKFLVFYILAGLATLGLAIVLAPHSHRPTIGAAGAIAAVLGGYVVLYPRARVLTLVLIILFFTVIELPTFVMLGIWFAVQALFAAFGLTNPIGGGAVVAYVAQLGSFALGALTIWLLATRRRQVQPPHPVY